MSHGITRRDFLDGVALTIAAGLAPQDLFAAQAVAYPPALTGDRGSTPAAYLIGHSVRDGKRFDPSKLAADETVDLLVVGSGISGLAAAHFYRASHPKARVLILENHDEFGGHARRNEFTVGGRQLIGYGGSEAIQSPKSEWSKTASGLLVTLGIQVDRFNTAFNRSLYPGLGLSRALFFKKDTFGADKLVTGDPTRMVADDIPPDRMNARSVAAFVADFPLPAEQKQKIVALYTEKRDVLKGKTNEEKEDFLWTLSYRDFVMKRWGLSDLAAKSFQGRSNDFFAIGVDAVPAHDAMDTGYPGFQGLGLTLSDEAKAEIDDPYIYHFPDGNASIARSLVRKLIPAVAPGTTMDDIVTAKFDYTKLDEANAPVRLRLNSTVVSLKNLPSGLVDVGYVAGPGLHRVQAKRAIYAGYGMMLPYICPDVGKKQHEALSAGVKAPLVYVNVAVNNWQPWAKLKVHEITNPMGFFSRLKLDYPVSLGSYQCSSKPEQPILLHLVHVPTVPIAGLDQRAAWRAARAVLYAMPFSEFEKQVRDELTRMLGGGGFNADRDIAGITVNRWGHGYAYGINTLWDEEPEPPVYEIARKKIGHLAIAGSDAVWQAYAHAAIDEAHRAVGEISA
ncbi:MAG TPA: FAD/NAD(P)-binding protein [Steroidobacteraceae bacterium]|nr:FAD/NAD(P)-binding protein [Steroidobacteraceae bacterium]